MIFPFSTNHRPLFYFIFTLESRITLKVQKISRMASLKNMRYRKISCIFDSKVSKSVDMFRSKEIPDYSAKAEESDEGVSEMSALDLNDISRNASPMSWDSGKKVKIEELTEVSKKSL